MNATFIKLDEADKTLQMYGIISDAGLHLVRLLKKKIKILVNNIMSE